MDDLTILQNKEIGLNAMLKDLREKESAFLKVQGIDEQIVKTGNEIQSLEVDSQSLKEEIAELRFQKAAALQGTSEAMAKKMKAILIDGNPFFDIENGKVLIGWELEGNRIPYAGLSGGQKAMFDAALAATMLGDSAAKLIIVEAAEIDYENFLQFLEKINADESGAQWIINNWLDVFDVPDPPGGFDDWNIFRIDSALPVLPVQSEMFAGSETEDDIQF